MSNEDISADFPRLQQASVDIKQGAQEISQILEDMERDLQKVQWSGESAEAYTRSQAQWSSGMQGLQQVLNGVGGAVDGAVQRYIANEQRGAQTWA